MAKTIEKTPSGATLGFYRPHKRVTFRALVLDPKTGEVTDEPSRTKQEFAAECDINNIIKSYKLTGQIQHINRQAQQGRYEDLPDAADFQESMNLVIEAQNAFATLPSQVRSRFANDPANFLAFMANPANIDEAVKLGLATKTAVPSPEPKTARTEPTGGEGGSPPSGGAPAP